MRIATKPLAAVAILALAGLGAWLALRDGGDSTRPVTPATPARAAVVQPKHGFRALRLPDHGYRLVWLRRDAHVDMRTEPGGGKLVDRLDWKTEFGERTVLSVFERRKRWAGVPTAALPNGRLGWVKLDARKLQASSTTYSIVIDLPAYRAELLRNGKVLRSFPVTIGAPGSETPTGRFAVTDDFRGTLNPAAYGCCALALTANQPHLPSGWLGGNIIAIHGTAGPLGVAASHGCVRAADDDVRALQDAVPLGTPVVIRG